MDAMLALYEPRQVTLDTLSRLTAEELKILCEWEKGTNKRKEKEAEIGKILGISSPNFEDGQMAASVLRGRLPTITLTLPPLIVRESVCVPHARKVVKKLTPLEERVDPILNNGILRSASVLSSSLFVDNSKLSYFERQQEKVIAYGDDVLFPLEESDEKDTERQDGRVVRVDAKRFDEQITAGFLHWLSSMFKTHVDGKKHEPFSSESHKSQLKSGEMLRGGGPRKTKGELRKLQPRKEGTLTMVIPFSCNSETDRGQQVFDLVSLLRGWSDFQPNSNDMDDFVHEYNYLVCSLCQWEIMLCNEGKCSAFASASTHDGTYATRVEAMEGGSIPQSGDATMVGGKTEKKLKGITKFAHQTGSQSFGKRYLLNVDVFSSQSEEGVQMSCLLKITFSFTCYEVCEDEKSDTKFQDCSPAYLAMFDGAGLGLCYSLGNHVEHNAFAVASLLSTVAKDPGSTTQQLIALLNLYTPSVLYKELTMNTHLFTKRKKGREEGWYLV